MAERKTVDGSMALADKQVRVITIAAAEKPQAAKLRVAAYARVSSSSADQLNSFAAQNDYYQNLIRTKENWTLADIYADESIILGLGQEVLVPQGFPGLVLIFIRLRICGPSGRMIEKCVELSPSPIRRVA